MKIDLSLEKIEELKNIFKKDSRLFIQNINKNLSFIKAKEDIEDFCLFVENLKEEIEDVSPFLSEQINRIFCLMIKKHFYKEVANYISLIEKCVNFETITLLKAMITNKNIEKFITTLDIYRIKKLIFEVSKKKKNTENIFLKIKLEPEQPILEWLDII